MIDFVEKMLVGSLIPITIVIAVVAIIDRGSEFFSASNRSWLWRAVYLKVAFVCLFPLGIGIPLVKIPEIAAESDLDKGSAIEVVQSEN